MFNFFSRKKVIYHENIPLVYSKYRFEFGSSKYYLSYLGDTIEDVFHAIDSDKRLDDDQGLKDIIKNGYFGEFLNREYYTKDYIIDNCMHFMWTVRYGDEFI